MPLAHPSFTTDGMQAHSKWQATQQWQMKLSQIVAM